MSKIMIAGIVMLVIGIFGAISMSKKQTTTDSEEKEKPVEKKAILGAGLSYMTCAVIAVALFWGTIMAVCTLSYLGVISVDWGSLGRNIWEGIKFVIGLGILYIILAPIFDSFRKKVV